MTRKVYVIVRLGTNEVLAGADTYEDAVRVQQTYFKGERTVVRKANMTENTIVQEGV